jgi:hypothetical protein
MSFLSLGNSSFSDPYNPTEAVLNSRMGETEKWGNAKENEDKLRGFSFTLDKQKKMEKALEKAQSYIGGQNKIAGFANLAGDIAGFGLSGGFDGLFKGAAPTTSGIGSGVGQASLTPGIDIRPDFSNRINPIGGFGGVMNA